MSILRFANSRSLWSRTEGRAVRGTVPLKASAALSPGRSQEGISKTHAHAQTTILTLPSVKIHALYVNISSAIYLLLRLGITSHE